MKMGVVSKALERESYSKKPYIIETPLGLDLVMSSGSFGEDIARYWMPTNNNGSQTKIHFNQKNNSFFNYITKSYSKGRKKW
jgi:hypothetical protein